MSSNHAVEQSTTSETASVLAGPIAIIGVSGRYPGGANSPDLLWETLTTGRDAVGEAQGDRWDLGWHHPDPQRPGRVYTKAGGFLDQVDGFDAEFFGLSPREARQMDPQQRLLLELAWEAHEDAGYAPKSRAGSDTGVFVGISSNDYSNLVGAGWPDAYSNTGSSFSISPNRISYIFDFHGPSVAVDTACSSSIVCVHQACMSLLAGECSTALAGGVSVLTHIRPWLGFARASMLSPTGRCKSFDASGDGYVRSEGGGLVLLKPLAAAEKDEDRILGVIVASGVNSDGRTMGLSMPNGEAQEKLLRKVYETSGIRPDDVFYVEAHGTGTAVGDPIECGALGRVLGTPREGNSSCLIGSVKSNIGHLEAASGIAGLTKALLILRHRQIPGNLHFNNPNPKIDFEGWKLNVVTHPTPLPDSEKPIVIGINSFGFGGTNAHVALQEYRASKPCQTAPTNEPSVLLISAHSEVALKEVSSRYIDVLKSDQNHWEDICAAAATTRSPLRCRLAIQANHSQEGIEKLERFIEGETQPGAAIGNSSTPKAKIAFVYSGNGPQWWGMGRELLAENPTFRREIEAVDEIFAPLAGWSLLKEMSIPESENRMALTEVAQPMLFALQLGLTAVLREAGIEPDAVVGHSVGEAAAAYASGALNLSQATKVIYHRSKEQSKTAGMGRMAALGVSQSEALTAIEAVDGWLELAAINSPQSVTVAGDPIALEQLVDQMTVAGKFARVLPLNYPFHTKAMEPIREDLQSALNELVPSDSRIPLISTVEGTTKSGNELDAEYWFRNVREPVLFSQSISHLLRENEISVFLEIGPHPVLKDYVVQCAKETSSTAVALPSLKRPGRGGPEPESANLATAICACYAYGASDLAKRYKRPLSLPALPLYPWQRERHWRGAVLLPDTFNPIVRDHPLLGHRLPAVNGLWENVLDINQLPYLKDHVVQDSVLFPAAGYIEMALSAAKLSLGAGTLDVETFEILRPLAIPAQSDPLIQTSIDSRDGTVEISSRMERDSSDWTVHVRCRLSRTEPRNFGDVITVPTNLEEITSRTTQLVTQDEHYGGANKRGLAYGPAFQGVGNIWLTDPLAHVREALAEIRLPQSETGDLTSYLAHPSLLDSCIQVLITLIGQNDDTENSTIPVQVERVRSIAPLTGEMMCHVTMRSESSRSAVADFRVMDLDGNLLLAIDEARCQKVDFRHVGPAPLTSEWWRPDPSSIKTADFDSLPGIRTAVEAVEKQLPEITTFARRNEFYREVRPELNRLIGAYAAKTILQLSAGESDFDLNQLAKQEKIGRDQLQLLANLIRLAQEDEYLAVADGKYRWQNSMEQPCPEAIWKSIFERFPHYQVELLLIAQEADSLISRLRDDEVSNEAASLIDQLKDTAPFQRVYNLLLRSAVETIVSAWPKSRPIRILELKGSGGGLAAWILPILPSERTDYLFTDPSDASLGRAEHRLAGHRFVRFANLDLNLDLVDQGQPANYFDLVIGSQLEAPEALLDRVQKVMAEDGIFLFSESIPDRFSDLIFGNLRPILSADASECRIRDFHEIDDQISGEEFGRAQQKLVLGQLAKEISQTPQSVIWETRKWLLLTEDPNDPLVSGASKILGEKGQTVSIIHLTSTESLEKALLKNTPDQVVYFSAVSKEDFLRVEEERIANAVQLVKSLELFRQDNPVALTFVTRGAFPTLNGETSIDPGQAPLWGLGRVIGNEHSGLNLRMIDSHVATEAPGNSDLNCLVDELLRQDEETEVQLSAGQRYVNRERLTTFVDESRQSGHTEPSIALDFLPQGGLESLYLRASERRDPLPHQVEIQVKAAGLNFRDVLWSMGMLPEEAVEHGFSGPTIGMECSGEIIRVGSEVKQFKPGDRVVAFASSCFGSFVTTDEESVAHLPNSIEFAAGATIPTVFLTSFYALDYLARLEAGETVLIHGAAGGVGLAAIQIAKMKGAKIIGTAGSSRKRKMLEMLGVDYVLNSRSLDFADEVMKLTDGIGVDVVLNSLAGEAITKSLQCLRPFGRFLEIGKRDLYANSKIGLRPFRNNLSYFGIDADTLLIERRDLAQRLFRTLLQHFVSGVLRPIPYQEFPISRASEAFRAMQQSRHVGKLVISMELDRLDKLPIVSSNSRIRPGVTYLVTGGLGGFGLATAKWLAQQGATSLALISRRGESTDEARQGVQHLRGLGVSVKAFAADISNMSALKMVIEEIRSEMSPLAGVFHSAAVIEDAPIMNLDSDQIDRVFRPKMLGAWNLHEATKFDPLDIFVMYSSSSAVVGNPGQGAYVAANLYLDALALHRRSIGLPALAIGWGAIKDAGFLTRNESVAGMLKSRTGLDATPSEELLADMGRLLSVGANRVSVARFDLQRLAQMLPGARVPRFLPIVPKGAAASLQADETLADAIKSVAPADRRAYILARIQTHAASVLGTSSSQVMLDKPLPELGLDSLMAVELAGALERDLGQPISVMQMLSATSLTSIGELVMKILGIDAGASDLDSRARESSAPNVLQGVTS